MTFGSLFSGAGGFDLGFHRAGLECQWQVEIDPQASSVLAKHWPDVRRHGDITKVRKKDIDRVDVLIGGFPCQDLSVAGNRKGLSGERSGLYYELLRVVGLCRPRFVVWENVPGLLSSDDGRDFGRVLRGLADLGYFGAWRVLDARFFGVPQRRRRVFGVFARGRVGAVRCGQILALAEGVRGHSATGGQAGKDVAPTLTQGLGRRGGQGDPWNTPLAGRGTPVVFCPDEAFTLKTQCGRVGNWWNGNMAVSQQSVRRLTPRECERLMSWPDDWTRYAADGTEFADGPRYRMCGNGVVANVAEWIARRLLARAGRAG